MTDKLNLLYKIIVLNYKDDSWARLEDTHGTQISETP